MIEYELIFQVLNVFRVVSCLSVYAKRICHEFYLKRSERSVEDLAGECRSDCHHRVAMYFLSCLSVTSVGISLR